MLLLSFPGVLGALSAETGENSTCWKEIPGMAVELQCRGRPLHWGEGKAGSEEAGAHSKLPRGAFGTGLLKWQAMPTEEGAFEIDPCWMDLRVKFMPRGNVCKFDPVKRIWL